MTRTTPELRRLAEQLMTIEGEVASTAQRASAARVCDRFGAALGILLGTAGFSALLSRALALAQAEARELGHVQLKPDGSLEGLEGVERHSETVLVAHLLGLLITFVGAALTMRLLQDLWPTAAIVKLDQGSDR